MMKYEVSVIENEGVGEEEEDVPVFASTGGFLRDWVGKQKRNLLIWRGAVMTVMLSMNDSLSLSL